MAMLKHSLEFNKSEGNVLFKNAFKKHILYMVMLQWAYDIGHSVREETCCCHFMGYSF